MKFSEMPRIEVFSGMLQTTTLGGNNLLFFTRTATNDEDVVEVFIETGDDDWRRARRDDVINQNTQDHMSVKDVMSVWALFGESGMKDLLKIIDVEKDAKIQSRFAVNKWKRRMAESLFEKISFKALKGPVSLCILSMTFKQYLDEKAWKHESSRIQQKSETTGWKEIVDVLGETFRFKRSIEDGEMVRVFVKDTENDEWISTPNGSHYDRIINMERFQENGQVSIEMRDILWMFVLFGSSGMHLVQKILAHLLHPADWKDYGIAFNNVRRKDISNLPEGLQQFYERVTVERFSQESAVPLSEANKRLLMGFQKWTREEEDNKRQKL